MSMGRDVIETLFDERDLSITIERRVTCDVCRAENRNGLSIYDYSEGVSCGGSVCGQCLVGVVGNLKRLEELESKHQTGN